MFFPFRLHPLLFFIVPFFFCSTTTGATSSPILSFSCPQPFNLTTHSHIITSCRVCGVQFGDPQGVAHDVIAYANCNNNSANLEAKFDPKTWKRCELEKKLKKEEKKNPDDQCVVTGMEWQCVEYARRFLMQRLNVTFSSVASAFQIFYLKKVEIFVASSENLSLNFEEENKNDQKNSDSPFLSSKNEKKKNQQQNFDQKKFFKKNDIAKTTNSGFPFQSFSNLNKEKPQVNDLLIYSSTPEVPHGHVAVIVAIEDENENENEEERKKKDNKKIKISTLFLAEQNMVTWAWTGPFSRRVDLVATTNEKGEKIYSVVDYENKILGWKRVIKK